MPVRNASAACNNLNGEGKEFSYVVPRTSRPVDLINDEADRLFTPNRGTRLQSRSYSLIDNLTRSRITVDEINLMLQSRYG